MESGTNRQNNYSKISISSKFTSDTLFVLTIQLYIFALTKNPTPNEAGSFWEQALLIFLRILTALIERSEPQLYRP